MTFHCREPSITVQSNDTLAAVVCNEKGEFRFHSMKVGRYTLRCSYVGCKPAVLNTIELTSGKELVIPVVMEEQYITAREVIFSAGNRKELPVNKMALESTRSITVEETERYAGS